MSQFLFLAHGNTKTWNPESGNGNGITETEAEAETQSRKRKRNIDRKGRKEK